MARKAWTKLWLVTLLGCIFPPQGSAQERPDEVSRFGARHDAFRLLFADKGLALGSVSEFESSPPDQWRDWIVVVLGDVGAWSRFGISEHRLLSAGGRILIATDQSCRIDLAERLDLRAGWMETPPDAAYQGRDACPILSLNPSARLLPMFGSLVEGVEAIVLNRSGWIVGKPARWFELAWLPQGTRMDGTIVDPPPAAVAAWLQGNGRALVIADQSLFMNEMILELDNLVFARNVVDWLSHSREPARTKVLFLDHGQAPTEWVEKAFLTGNFAEPPTLDDLLTLANAMAVGLEDENAFNDMIVREQNRLSPIPFRQVILLAGTSALLLMLAWSLHSSRSPREPRIPLTRNNPAPPLDQRRQAVTELDDFADPARRLAEEFFLRATMPGTFSREDWRLEHPTIEFLGDSWLRWRVQRRIQRLWLLAMGENRRPIRRHRFIEIRDQVAALEEMRQKGTISLRFSERAAARAR